MLGRKNPALAERNRTHGMRHTKEYSTWSSMMQRCNSPGNPAYHNYGGRGIKVCKRWRTFENFYADMGKKPLGVDLDRIDNNKGYSLKNCRWASRKENIRNTRVAVRIRINGITKNAAEWAEIIGGERHLVLKRYRNGDRGDALLRPSQKRKTRELEGV